MYKYICIINMVQREKSDPMKLTFLVELSAVYSVLGFFFFFFCMITLACPDSLENKPSLYLLKIRHPPVSSLW